MSCVISVILVAYLYIYVFFNTLLFCLFSMRTKCHSLQQSPHHPSTRKHHLSLLAKYLFVCVCGVCVSKYFHHLCLLLKRFYIHNSRHLDIKKKSNVFVHQHSISIIAHMNSSPPPIFFSTSQRQCISWTVLEQE